jgi:hypothetical protein
MKKIFCLFVLSAWFWAARITPLQAASSYSIVLDWSANTYSPLSYTAKAKTMPINGSTLTVYANIFSVAKTQTTFQYQKLEPAQYTFTWYVNDKKLESGAGQDIFRYTIPRGIFTNQVSIKLEAANETSIIGNKTLTIPVLSEPEVRIFREQNNKLIPLVITNVTGAKQTIVKLIPLPYFFNVSSPIQLSFLWYEGKKRLPSNSYTGGVFEIKLPDYAASDSFKSVIYNNSFDLELGQQDIEITSK